MENEMILFKDGDFKLDVNVEKETVWLSQAQICDLFERERTVITRHINNIFKEGELDKKRNVQKIHTPISDKPVNTYSLDVIISVGYRVKSVRGTKFRTWANNILTEYLVKGYVVDINRLERENEKLKELQQVISFIHGIAINGDSSSDEIKNLLSVVQEYEYALDLLDKYDHKTLSIENVSNAVVRKVSMVEVYEIIEVMSTDFTTDLFGKEKDESLSGSINNIYQTAFGDDVYPSLEEKASNLLYFLVKNHSFVDGNKRIAAAVFVYFLRKNEIYHNQNGGRRLSDDALVALTILIAESDRKEKDIMIKIMVNLISRSDLVEHKIM